MEKEKVDIIVKDPENYFKVQGKKLEARLDEIKVDEQQVNQIMKEKTINVVRDTALGLLGGFGGIISTIINWSEEIENDLSEAKRIALMERYFNKVDDVESATKKLTEFLTNPEGYTVYNKVVRILDNYPPDAELMEHLSKALKYAVEKGEFENLFESHKFTLSQIEILTPQSLTIVSDYKNWPLIKFPGGVFINGKLNSPWHDTFADAYCFKKGIFDRDKITRVSYSVRELDGLGCLKVSQLEEGRLQIELTEVGKELADYIK